MAVRAGSTRQVMLSLRWRQFLRAGGSSSGSLARSCCSRSAVRIRPPATSGLPQVCTWPCRKA